MLTFRKIAYYHQNNSAFDCAFLPDLALTKLSENILDNLDNGSVTSAVFLDLKKAFETVDHKRMTKKLHCYGLDMNALSWFEYYICPIANKFLLSKTVSLLLGQLQSGSLKEVSLDRYCL